jgi:hypothetical protein
MPTQYFSHVPAPRKPTPDGEAYLAKIQSRYQANPSRWEGLYHQLFWTCDPAQEAIYNKWLHLQPKRHEGTLNFMEKKWEAANWQAAIEFRNARKNWHKRRDQKIRSAYLSALKNYNKKCDVVAKHLAKMSVTVRPNIPLPDTSLPPPGYVRQLPPPTREIETQTEDAMPIQAPSVPVPVAFIPPVAPVSTPLPAPRQEQLCEKCGRESNGFRLCDPCSDQVYYDTEEPTHNSNLKTKFTLKGLFTKKEKPEKPKPVVWPVTKTFNTTSAGKGHRSKPVPWTHDAGF